MTRDMKEGSFHDYSGPCGSVGIASRISVAVSEGQIVHLARLFLSKRIGSWFYDEY